MWRWSSSSARRSALALVAALSLSAGARAQDEWRTLREADGVRVSERGGAERALPELRGEVEIAAPLARVLAVIEDVPGQTKWMHDCAEARVLRREPPDTTLVYNRTSAPWPVSDRDAVLRTVIAPRGPETALVRFGAVADAAAPPLDGIVRMPKLEGEFALTALGAARTRVVYRLDIDPGGALPVWLARRTARDLPFETLRGLRREAVGSSP